jgi:hypothetical protein
MRQRRHKIEQTTTTTAAETNADTLNSFEIHYDAIMRVKIELVRVLLEYGCDPNRGLALTNRNKFVINMDSSLLNSNNYNPRRCSLQTDQKASANNYDDNNNSYSLKSCEQQQQQSQHNDVVEETSADATIGRNASRSMSLATANALATAASHHITSSSSLMLNTDVSFVTKSLVDEKKFNALNATPIDSPLLILCCVFNCHNLANLNAGNSSGNNSSRAANSKRRDDSTSSNGINSKKNQTKASSVSSSSRYSTSSKTRINRVNSGVLYSNVSKIIQQQQQQQKRQRDHHHHQYNQQQHRRHTIQMTSTVDGCGRKDVSNEHLVQRQQSDEKHLENNNCKINESLIPEGSEVVEEKNKVRPFKKTILLICFKSFLSYPESLNTIQGNA